MPWDNSHVRTWELTKAGPRMSLVAYRSGCYKRAITVLQDENGDSDSRASAAASLHKAIQNAHVRQVADSRPASTEQAESGGAAQLLPGSDKATQKQEKLDTTAIRQHLRRQRQEERLEHNKKLWQQRYEQKMRARQHQLAVQVQQRREQQTETMEQLERQKQALEQQVQQNKHASAAIIQAEQVHTKDLTSGLQAQLTEVQQKKAVAEEQLAKACQAGEHMSRRAASIEPEDGECTPSPSAVQQAQYAAKHHAVGQKPIMQALPPPPPPAGSHPQASHQFKDGYGRGSAASGMSDKAAYSPHQFPDSLLPPPPPLR